MVDPRLRAWVRGTARLPLGGEPRPAPHPACEDAGAWGRWAGLCQAAGDLEGALWGYALAHGYHRRASEVAGARDGAAGAYRAARLLGDAEALRTWRAMPRGTVDPDLEEAERCWDQGEPLKALRRLEPRLAADTREGWRLLARLALDLRRPDLGRRALPRIEGALAALVGAWVEGRPLPRCLDPDLALEAARLGAEGFWEAWGRATSRPRRLVLGLEALAADPGACWPERLAALQALVDAGGTASQRARLEALWPQLETGPALDPEAVVLAWLRERRHPTWVLAGRGGAARLVGEGRPPEPLLARIRATGYLAPVVREDRIWWARPLPWAGRSVGAVIQARPLGVCDPDPPAWALVAPWAACLEPPALPPPVLARVPSLLADGSEPMGSLLREAARVAPSRLPVLLLGPTGSGKELLAQEIHARSGRTGPLVCVNCAALAEGLLESELFGHVKGAYTGADRERRGAFEAADRGTLFLDEVADLGTRTQSLLLRALQEGEVRKVGSDAVRRVDVRILAATHLDLEARVAEGSFRRDLWFRLQGCVLVLPSLAERRHEFAYLIPRLLARLAEELGREAPELAPGLVEALAHHPWPGNFRELGHALERALLRCPAGVLGERDFPELARKEAAPSAWDEAQQAFRRRLILDSLKRHGFQVAETARALGLSRPALYQAARKAGLDLPGERLRFEMPGAM